MLQNTPERLRSHVGNALPVQISWALLAALWNLVGVVLIAGGHRPPGPTASVAGAVALVVLAVLLPLSTRRWPWLYLLLTAVAGAMGTVAVVNAFVQDEALWPSEFWRYAGVVLNGVGAAAAFVGIAGFIRWRSGKTVAPARQQ